MPWARHSSEASWNVVLDHVPTVRWLKGAVPEPSEQIDTQVSPLSEQQRVAARPVSSSVHALSKEPPHASTVSR